MPEISAMQLQWQLQWYNASWCFSIHEDNASVVNDTNKWLDEPINKDMKLNRLQQNLPRPLALSFKINCDSGLFNCPMSNLHMERILRNPSHAHTGGKTGSVPLKTGVRGVYFLNSSIESALSIKPKECRKKLAN